MKLKKIRFSIFFFLMIGSTPIFAQASSSSSAPPATQSPKAKTEQTISPAAKTTLDTEESFKYLGNQLLFQMKKRLNLTTEEEEKKQDKSTENKKFSFFGIEIEKG